MRRRSRPPTTLAPARLVAALVGVGAVVAGVVLLAVDGGPGRSSDARSVTTVAAPRSVVTALPATLAAPTTSTLAPGALPQTEDRPTTTSAPFRDHVAALWQAIVGDDADVAMPFFFPLGAYLQVKAIGDPEADWRNRLVAQFVADVHALHGQLGADAASAQLVGIDVPESAATWVLPGAEFNKGAYWRVYDSQLRYRVGGETRSFPVKSMISWRGEWYVVHLTAIR